MADPPLIPHCEHEEKALETYTIVKFQIKKSNFLNLSSEYEIPPVVSRWHIFILASGGLKFEGSRLLDYRLSLAKAQNRVSI